MFRARGRDAGRGALLREDPARAGQGRADVLGQHSGGRSGWRTRAGAGPLLPAGLPTPGVQDGARDPGRSADLFPPRAASGRVSAGSGPRRVPNWSLTGPPGSLTSARSRIGPPGFETPWREGTGTCAALRRTRQILLLGPSRPHCRRGDDPTRALILFLSPIRPRARAGSPQEA